VGGATVPADGERISSAGTDAGGWVHRNNAQKINCLGEADMTSVQAIVAATGDAAQCLDIYTDLGIVEAGKTADLILVNGDPLSDRSIHEEGRAVRLVIKDGDVIVDRLAMT
jgi:imidazolonepropionase-like amidohydrolase